MADKTIEETIRETTKGIDKAREKLNPEFSALVKNLNQTNQELAKEVAGIRLSAKNTFAGALQAGKFKRVGESLNKLLDKGSDALDPKQFEELKANMTTFKEEEWASYKELNDNVKSGQEEIIALEKQKSDRIAAAEKRGNTLWKAEQDIQEQKEKLNSFAVTGGVIYERELTKLQGMQEAEVEKRKSLTAFADAEIKEKTEQLDKELKERQLFNDKAVEQMKELNANAGKLGTFTDGIRDLTGVDIGGMIDGMMSKVNSLGKVLTGGKQENMANVLIEKLTEGFSKLGDALGGTLGMFAGSAGAEALGKNLGDNFRDNLSKYISDPIKAFGTMIGDSMNFIFGAPEKVFKFMKTKIMGVLGPMKDQFILWMMNQKFALKMQWKQSALRANLIKIQEFSFKKYMASKWSEIMQSNRMVALQNTLNKVRSFSFKAWLAAQWAWIKQTKLMTGLQKVVQAVRVFSFKAWLITQWRELSIMIKETAQRIALNITRVIVWVANMAAQALQFLSMMIPVLPIVAIAVAVIALGALLIWAGMKLYEESELFRSIIDAVVGYFKNIVSILGDIFGGFYDFFAGLFTGDWDRMFGGLKDIFGGLWDLIMAPFNMIFDWLKDTFGIDIGGMIKDLARKILPDWALNLLGMGGSDQSDKLQEALVTEKSETHDADLKAAEASGLYKKEGWLAGESGLDESKIGDASDDELKAIINDNDISDENKLMLLKVLQSRAQIGSDVPSAGEEIGDASTGLDDAKETAGDVNLSSQIITDNSSQGTLNITQDAKETDRGLMQTSGLQLVLE